MASKSYMCTCTCLVIVDLLQKFQPRKRNNHPFKILRKLKHCVHGTSVLNYVCCSRCVPHFTVDASHTLFVLKGQCRRFPLSRNMFAFYKFNLHECMYIYVKMMTLCCSCSHTQTYNIGVEHATKMEISALKSIGAVGGKAGRSALFRAGDVCQMFEHWKAHPPLALRQLANGKV